MPLGGIFHCDRRLRATTEDEWESGRVSLFSDFRCHAKRASVSGDGEDCPMERGAGLAADGELVHQTADKAAPLAVADGSSPSRLPWSRVAPPSASLPLCVSA